MTNKNNKYLHMKKNILLVFIILFGLVTLFMSSSVLFDWFGMREKEDNYVLFIVWTNWLCGILYLISAFGILKNKTWVKFTLLISLLILILSYFDLFIHIKNGGIYETKTIIAMAFRIGVTAIFLLTTIKILKK